MDVSRRTFLGLSGAAAAAATAPRWLYSGVSARPRIGWNATLAGDMPEPDLAALLASRAMFGSRPGDVEHIRDIGPAAWIEEQLDYEAIDDSDVEDRLAGELPTLAMSPRDLLAYRDEDYRYVPRDELRLATIYRMAFSPRQLYEVMVEFWSDHFCIYHMENYCPYLKTVDDREVIRRHALGSFKDLLTASAMSPAMLSFLDNDVSTKQRPNENYAREIMELHTLGVAVDGYPYTEEDVKQVSKCFTGWTWDRRPGSGTLGQFLFSDANHWEGSKEVLGHSIPAAGGIQDGHDVIDILCNHPETPVFLATKLVRRFVTDDPMGQTPDLVGQVADAYTRTNGDLKEMVRTVFYSREFAASFATYGGRLSRPTDLIVRQLRGLSLPADRFTLALRGGGSAPYRNTMLALAAMGHVPYNWPDPDGYPDVKERWSGASPLLTRWNLGLAMVGAGGTGTTQFIPGFLPAAQTPGSLGTAGEVVDYWLDRLLHREMTEEDRGQVIEYLAGTAEESTPVDSRIRQRVPMMIALILDSPYFQWR